jgi:hypothetical protein
MRRAGAVLLIAAVTAVLAWTLVVLPYRCNLVEGEVDRATKRIWDRQARFQSRTTAARNIERLMPCIERCRTDVNLRVLAGDNLALLDRWDAAAAMYRQALELDQRPEVYFALGYADFHAGRREQALQNFIVAGTFSGTAILDEIPDGELRLRAHDAVGRKLEVAHARREVSRFTPLKNGGFTTIEKGATRTLTTAGRGASPASDWQLLNTGGTVSASATVSTRRGGGNALQVVASRAGSGIVQQWPVHRSRVRTVAWVYVMRGAVAAGSGRNTGLAGEATTSWSGRWERLESVSTECPPSTTMIVAARRDTEFLVDQVTVSEALDVPPCAR